jgi:replicative DNA helicase
VDPHRPRSTPPPAAGEVRALSPGAGPLHDLDAEVAVLGSVLLDPTVIGRVRDLVDPDDFYRENNGTIIRAALNLFAESRPIDLITLAGELARLDALDKVGGRAHLALLQESVPTAANAEHYALRVRDLAVMRRVGAEALQVAQAAADRRSRLSDLSDRVEGLRDVVGRETPWQPPLPLVDTGGLPEFPLEALPDWCGAFAAALAEATQTPRDLAGMIVLASLATCAGGRVRVEIKPGWEEPLNLYVLVALPPGERKSAVFEAATAPLSEFEEERARAVAPLVTEGAIRRKALERACESAQAEAAKAKTDTAREAAIERATELAKDAEAVIVPAAYRLLADDATPEILASLLAQQGGRIAVLSPEGGVVGQMAGRYSSSRVPGSNLGVYLKGHAGDRLRVDRVGRPAEYVSRPALTIGLAVQPEVLRTMAEVPELGGLGVLARFLYSLPASRMGDRSSDPDQVPPELAREYASKLCILARSLDVAGGWLIRFAPASWSLLREYAAALEPRLGDDGDLNHMRDWAGKLAGAIARVASLIHLGGSVRGAWGDEVPRSAVDAAILVGDYAIAHAQAAFALMGADPEVELARRVLRWIGNRKLTEFSRRDAFDQLRGNRLTKVTDLDPPLALLAAHDYIRPSSTAPGPAGGRPSQRYRVNPHAQNPQNPRNPAPAAPGGTGQ